MCVLFWVQICWKIWSQKVKLMLNIVCNSIFEVDGITSGQQNHVRLPCVQYYHCVRHLPAITADMVFGNSKSITSWLVLCSVSWPRFKHKILFGSEKKESWKVDLERILLPYKRMNSLNTGVAYKHLRPRFGHTFKSSVCMAQKHKLIKTAINFCARARFRSFTFMKYFPIWLRKRAVGQ